MESFEFKFRANRFFSNKKHGTKVFGSLLKYLEKNGEYSFYIKIEESTLCSVSKETISIFTGELDKNKKEIYTNDIVNFKSYSVGQNDFKGIVCFSCGQFFVKFKDEEGLEQAENVFNELGEFEVLGDIFDNPELLEGVIK